MAVNNRQNTERRGMTVRQLKVGNLAKS